MKQQFTEFTCDSCKKQELSDYGFPYEKQWVFIYKIDGKALESYAPGLQTDTKQINEKDKHFCSLKCLQNFIKEKFKTGYKKGKGEEKNVKRKN